MRKISIVILTALLFLMVAKVTGTTVFAETIAENEPATERILKDTEEGESEKTEVGELDLGDYQEQMTVGEKQLLNITILPLDAEKVTLKYHSSDTKVASVNGMGRITALTTGSTTITVAAGQVSQSFTLQVVEAENTDISVTDIEIGDCESELEVEKTMTISGTVLPAEAKDTTITYASSDTSIATVSSAGEVKGISTGNVTITLTAGEISKAVSLTVKVATTGIDTNSDYLILKPEETFQLSAKAIPVDAPQAISYKSADASVAAVSAGGLVTGKKTGTTTIIVSNGDSSVAVSVIVNQAVNYEQQLEDGQENTIGETFYTDTVLTSEQRVIDAQMLKHLYETKKKLKIIGDGYTIEIDGKNIVNYNNEFYTDISMEKEDGVLKFELNKGKELCGAVTLLLEEPEGKYLYLYNGSKEKYERIDSPAPEKLELTTAGVYQITDVKLKSDMQTALYIVAGGVVVLLIGAGAYIAVKRQYWFW